VVAAGELRGFRLARRVKGGLFQGTLQVGPVVQILAPFDLILDVDCQRGEPDRVCDSDLSG